MLPVTASTALLASTSRKRLNASGFINCVAGKYFTQAAQAMDLDLNVWRVTCNV
jgi:hypothetical protein